MRRPRLVLVITVAIYAWTLVSVQPVLAGSSGSGGGGSSASSSQYSDPLSGAGASAPVAKTTPAAATRTSTAATATTKPTSQTLPTATPSTPPVNAAAGTPAAAVTQPTTTPPTTVTLPVSRTAAPTAQRITRRRAATRSRTHRASPGATHSQTTTAPSHRSFKAKSTSSVSDQSATTSGTAGLPTAWLAVVALTMLVGTGAATATIRRRQLQRPN